MRALSAFSTMALVAVSVGALHCSAPADADDSVATTSEDLSTHCWADVLSPLPSTPVVTIGTVLTLRANPTPNCPPGVSEPLSYRFYLEGPSGPSGRISPEGATGWTTSTTVDYDTSSLPAGRYRFYLYSLPTSMVGSWESDNYDARETSHRSGYAYATLVGSASLGVGGSSYTPSVSNSNTTWTSYDNESCSGEVLTAISSGPNLWVMIRLVFQGGLPQSAGSYSLTPPFACSPTTTSVDVYRSTDGFATLQSWGSSLTSNPVQVVTEGDERLHVQIADTYAGTNGTAGTIAITSDIQL